MHRDSNIWRREVTVYNVKFKLIIVVSVLTVSVLTIASV
jgi:hypothetical protein